MNKLEPMNKDYTIHLKEEAYKIGVYIVPYNARVMEDSIFTTKLGFIDTDKDVPIFRTTNSEMMTLGVMQSIVYHWEQWQIIRLKEASNEENK